MNATLGQMGMGTMGQTEFTVEFPQCGHVVRVPANTEHTLVDCPLCGGWRPSGGWRPRAQEPDTLVDAPWGTAVLPLPTAHSVEPSARVEYSAPQLSPVAPQLAAPQPAPSAAPPVAMPSALDVGAGMLISAVSGFVRLGGQLDGALAGKRDWVLMSVACVYLIVAPVAEWVLAQITDYDTSLLSVGSGCSFALLMWVFALGRIDAWRDDDGFKLGLVWVQLKLLFRNLWEGTLTFVRGGAVGDRRCTLGALMIGGGFIALAGIKLSAALVEAAGYELEFAEHGQALFFFVALSGFICFRSGYSAWKNESADQGPEQASLAGSEVGQLPVLIDCQSAPGDATLVDTCPHAQVRRLVAALRCWKPRRFDYEAEYQNTLAWHLRRSLKVRVESEAHIKREADARGGAERGRIDLKIENLLIEVKRNLKGTEADRAVGQMEKYLRIWGNRGPIMLVLCGTKAEVARAKIVPAFENMRRRGYPVVAVLARA
ncbi:MAG: hypothetical protein R3B89_06405 [Polyangiaceae bacterium]